MSFCHTNGQGLKAVDGSIKKESDLPAADPNTPIPLKYEDRSTSGACTVEKGIALLLDRGQHLKNQCVWEGHLPVVENLDVFYDSVVHGEKVKGGVACGTQLYNVNSHVFGIPDTWICV